MNVKLFYFFVLTELNKKEVDVIIVPGGDYCMVSLCLQLFALCWNIVHIDSFLFPIPHIVQYCADELTGKLLASRVSSRPVDGHFLKKFMKIAPNPLKIYDGKYLQDGHFSICG